MLKGYVNPHQLAGRIQEVCLALCCYSKCSTCGHVQYVYSSLIFSCVQALPKPSREAQAGTSGAKKVLLSDVYGTAKRKSLLKRAWGKVDVTYSVFMLFIHGLCLFAPVTFSWPMVGLFVVSYLITGDIL